MSRSNKDKVPTQTASNGLFQAFAGLDISGLPPGSAEAGKSVPEPPPGKKGRVVLRRETAHRGGKTVVVIDGFEPSISAAFIEALAKKLRAACGCGGCVKARAIEIQGEQVPRVREMLAAEGFRVAGER